MSDTEAILVELRKISAYTDMQRKVAKRALIGLVIFTVVVVGAFTLFIPEIEVMGGRSASHPAFDWYDVDRYARAGDYAVAVNMAEQLVLKTPQAPDAHRRMADVYLSAGKLQKAREQYVEARRLFPSEQNDDLVKAMDKRLSDETSGSNP